MTPPRGTRAIRRSRSWNPLTQRPTLRDVRGPLRRNRRIVSECVLLTALWRPTSAGFRRDSAPSSVLPVTTSASVSTQLFFARIAMTRMMDALDGVVKTSICVNDLPVGACPDHIRSILGVSVHAILQCFFLLSQTVARLWASLPCI